MSADLSHFDKGWSDAHFASFLFYYYCKSALKSVQSIQQSIKKDIWPVIKQFWPEFTCNVTLKTVLPDVNFELQLAQCFIP